VPGKSTQESLKKLSNEGSYEKLSSLQKISEDTGKNFDHLGRKIRGTKNSKDSVESNRTSKHDAAGKIGALDWETKGTGKVLVVDSQDWRKKNTGGKKLTKGDSQDSENCD
jgi:hypothetical protein